MFQKQSHQKISFIFSKQNFILFLLGHGITIFIVFNGFPKKNIMCKLYVQIIKRNFVH